MTNITAINMGSSEMAQNRYAHTISRRTLNRRVAPNRPTSKENGHPDQLGMRDHAVVVKTEVDWHHWKSSLQVGKEFTPAGLPGRIMPGDSEGCTSAEISREVGRDPSLLPFRKGSSIFFIPNTKGVAPMSQCHGGHYSTSMLLAGSMEHSSADSPRKVLFFVRATGISGIHERDLGN
ncbi:hypothetical protein BC826DRAFT_972393 [Russula brevipes]|nr:hypothetical protein BC826DRAFT_972393 [Russula brevipes]